MAIADNFSSDPGLNNKAPPLGAPEGGLPRKQISDTFRTVMAAIKETAELAGSVISATFTAPGIIELATDAEVQAGTDAQRAVTPAGLRACVATDTRLGVIELATAAEAVTGTDATRAVTPVGLAARTLPASTTQSGVVELATEAETFAGTSDLLALSPNGFASNIGKSTGRGYIKFPGGTIKQYGVGFTGANGFGAISYTWPYQTNTVSLQITIQSPNYYMSTVTSINNNGFIMQMFDLSVNEAPPGVVYYWEATGY